MILAVYKLNQVVFRCAIFTCYLNFGREMSRWIFCKEWNQLFLSNTIYPRKELIQRTDMKNNNITEHQDGFFQIMFYQKSFILYCKI